MSTIATTYRVDGMTCDHCVASVRRELTGIPGVKDVSVTLEAGATSQVTVFSDGPLDPAAVAAAIDEAGYVIAPDRSLL